MPKGIVLKKGSEKVYPVPYWPIGSIYISVVNTNPSQWFGGTWQSFGSGRVLVGVDTSQTEFNTVQKTGGSKYIQKHYHDLLISTNTSTGGSVDRLSPVQINKSTTGRATFTSGSVNDTVETGNSGNLQPYITVYMWKRVA